MLNLDKTSWDRVTFGEVIQSVTDRVDDPAEAGVDRYVGLEHLDPGVLTIQRWDDPSRVSAQKLLFQPGDVVFGRRRAYQKKVARADFHGICSAHALVLRAVPGKIDPDFLPVFLSSDYFLDRAIGISVGSLSPTVNWRDLRGQEFDLPPMEEQRRIADLLWKVNAASSAAQAERDAALELRVKALEQELGNPGKDWAPTNLDSLIEHQIGGAWGKPPGESEVDVISFGTKAYGSGSSLDPSSGAKRSVTALQYQRRQLLAGDIILEVSGGSDVQPVGRALIVEEDMPEVIPSSFFRLLRFDQSKALPQFMLLYLQNMYETGVTREWQSNTTGIRNLNVKGFLSLPAVLPPLSGQQRIVNAMALLDGAISATQTSLDRLRDLRSSLLAELLTDASAAP